MNSVDVDELQNVPKYELVETDDESDHWGIQLESPFECLVRINTIRVHKNNDPETINFSYDVLSSDVVIDDENRADLEKNLFLVIMDCMRKKVESKL